MDDEYLRRMLAPFRRERAYFSLLWGTQWLLAMPPFAAVYVPLMYLMFPVPVPWVAAWFAILANAFIALCMIGIGMYGAWVFRRRRLAGFGYGAVLKAAFFMVRKDMPYLSFMPPP
ncbi:hypothetical protein [Glycomyces sp. NPDC021274]|uniref:hypothetical protein n=1 Tax=Glycomyces sp. NPDC021274 TaxID=3155120 RepID=UPI0033E334EB